MFNHPLPVHNIKIKIPRNLYADESGKEIDITQDGFNSCGIHVSWILYLMNSTLEYEKKPRWIKFTHATVHGTVKDILANGWHEIQQLKPGAVLLWEKREGGMFDGERVPKEHIGFCVSETEAISNDSKGTGFPWRHHITYGTNPDGAPVRKVEKILWHPALEDLSE